MLLNVEGLELQLVHLRPRENGRSDTQSWTFHALMLPSLAQVKLFEDRNLLLDPRELENPVSAFLAGLSGSKSHSHQALMEPTASV